MNKPLPPQSRTRAEALIALSTGQMTPRDVVALAEDNLGKDLRALTLREILNNTPRVDAHALLRRFVDFGVENPAALRVRDLLKRPIRLKLNDAASSPSRDLPSAQWPLLHAEKDS